MNKNISQKMPRSPESELHVAVIGTVGVPACYGGFELLVDNLLDFTPPNVEYTFFFSGKKYEKRLEFYKGAKLVYLEMDANGKDSIFYDFKSMKLLVAANADIMLILAFDCVYNRATTEEKCLYWKTAEDLQNLMKKLCHSERENICSCVDSESLRAKIALETGEAGKRLYSWEKIARQYNELY